MVAFEIREATPGDVPGILDIAERGWNAAYEHVLSQDAIDAAMDEWYDPDDIRDLIDQEDVAYYVADRDGEVLGYVSGGPGEDEGVAYLGAIYVAPDRWGEGIGSALLDGFESFCRDRGYETVAFNVLAENDVGVSFYRSHGYEAVERRETEVFGDAVEECVFRGSPE